MDSLEKLFLACLTLFGLFILFMFGLYFDLGDIVAGMLKKGESAATGIATADYQMKLMEWQGRPREVMPTNLMDSRYRPPPMPDDPMVALNRLLSRRAYFRPLTQKDRMSLRRNELRARGFVREDYVEMEVLSEDREDFYKVMTEARKMALDKQYGAAARMISDAIEQVSSKNLYVLKDYQSFLMQIYLDWGQLEKAEEVARKYYDLIDRILSIQRVAAGAEKATEIEQAQLKLKGEKDRLDEIFNDLKKRKSETGSPNGLYQNEKDEMRATLTRLRAEGRISDPQFRQALKDLGG